MLFCVNSGALDLIYPGTSLYEHILWMHLEKNRTYACTFPVQRKEINVVKFRFTMRFSSRKLSNDKVITTACNFWRQIACSFQVVSGNILFLGSKIFEISPFFQTRPGDLGKKVHACSLRFSALNMKPLVRTSFLGTRPSCLPSPGRPFFCTDDRKPNLWLGLPGSPVKIQLDSI